MPLETMTARERWLAVLTRKTPDRVPMDYWATPETNENLLRHLGCDDLDVALERLHVDRPVTVRPRYVGPAVPDGYDVFGVRYEEVDYGTGVYRERVYSPLAQYTTVKEIEQAYTWPSPDWWDHSGISGQIEGKEDRPIRGGGGYILAPCHNIQANTPVENIIAMYETAYDNSHMPSSLRFSSR